MLLWMLALPVRHQRMRNREGLGPGHGLSGLETGDFHLGDAVAQLDYYTAMVRVGALMYWKLLRESLRSKNRP